MTNDIPDGVRSYVAAYNQCFYDRDIGALRTLYAKDQFTVFWDNHPGCDADDVEAHFSAIQTFFATGKTTESGTVEPLIQDDTRIVMRGGMAAVTLILRYQSAPHPGVRSTFVLVEEAGHWKAVHIHHSFDPNEGG